MITRIMVHRTWLCEIENIESAAIQLLITVCEIKVRRVKHQRKMFGIRALNNGALGCSVTHDDREKINHFDQGLIFITQKYETEYNSWNENDTKKV